MNMTSTSPPISFSFGPPALVAGHGREALGLAELWAVARRHAGALCLWVALCLSAAIAYLLVTPPSYTATTLLLLDPVRPSVALSTAEGARLPIALDAAQAESHIQVVKSERILRFVFDTLDLGRTSETDADPPGPIGALIARLLPSRPETVDERRMTAFLRFMGRVGARRIGQSYAIEISYSSHDPIMATRIVDAITSAYLWDQVASARRGGEVLQTRIADLEAEAEAALDGVRQGRIPDRRFPDADARVISAALVPTAKAAPQGKLVIAGALSFALASSIGAVLVIHGLDRRIRTRRQIGRHLGLDCLAEVPHVSARQRRRLPSRPTRRSFSNDAFEQALRSARDTVIRLSLGHHHRAIGLVAWHPGEGTTTIVDGLARVVAASCEPVVLIDADLQHPDLTQALAPNATAGLTESLLARDPPEALPMLRLADHLTFVPAAGEDMGTSLDAFVGLPEMQRFIERLRERGSVLVDLPAASLSSDARVMGRMLDGLILVIEAARTTFDEAEDCLSALRKANIDVIGVILNHRRRG